MTTKKHTADYKARLKDKGLVRLELWVYPELKERIKAYANKLILKHKVK